MKPDAETIRREVLAEITAEEERLDLAQSARRDELGAISRHNDKLRAAHKAACDAARADLQAYPEPPELDSGQPQRDALDRILRARQALGDRRRQVLAAALPGVLDRWAEARPGLDEQAQRIYVEAEALAAEYAAWWILLRDCRRAADHDPNQVVRNGASERMRPKPEVAAVLLAAQGVDLCAAELQEPPTAVRHPDGTVELVQPKHVQVQRPKPTLGRRVR